MVSWGTIILFFVYLWGFGYTATYFLKNKDQGIEGFFEKLGIGLGVFAILSILLTLLRIPLDWKIFLFLSIIFPIVIAIKNKVKPNFTFTFKKSHLALLVVLLIAIFSFYTYLTGAFSYPYLENEDPWGHAVGTKYVALEKTALDPDLPGYKADKVLSYIDPYPPAYNIFMGVLHQTSPNLPWTLKFFNALLISLGFIWFYLFAKKFTANRNKAILATFFLAMIPSYLSHFIWAHSLVIVLFFPTMYALLKSYEEKQWNWVVAILVAAIWVSQNISQPLKLTTLLLIYLIVASITHKKCLKQQFAAVGGGILLSFLWWGTMMLKYGLSTFISLYGSSASSLATGAVQQSFFSKLLSLPGAIFAIITNPRGTASRAYTFSDFFFAKSNNLINSPIGIGIFLSVLTLIGVAFLLAKRDKLLEKNNLWQLVALFWLVYTFWGVNGMTFPFSIAKGPFRVWPLLAIPLVLIATEGFDRLRQFFNKPEIVGHAVAVVLILGVIMTSGVHKYEHNTTIWPTSGSFTSAQEPFLYGEWFATIPDDTKVFLYSPRDKLTIGFGKYSCLWCKDVLDFREGILDRDVAQLYTFLKDHEYEYLILNPRMDLKYLKSEQGDAQQVMQERYTQILESGKFTPVAQHKDMFLALKVN